METGMNTLESSIIYLLNNSIVITVTRHTSRQFNTSLRVKINDIEFEG